MPRSILSKCVFSLLGMLLWLGPAAAAESTGTAESTGSTKSTVLTESTESTESTGLSDGHKKAAVYRMYAQYKEDFPAVADISPRAAMALWEQGRALFVDTREPAEIKVSRLPGAVTRAEFLQDPTRYGDRTVVVYCTISYRSGVFASKMARQGIRLHNLAGGILAWALEGGKVYDDGGESRRLHVYGKKWDYVPQGYESVRFGWLEQVF